MMINIKNFLNKIIKINKKKIINNLLKKFINDIF
jgi:hypothetical protein